MGLIDVGGIIVAIIAALGAWAAQRAAAKASRIDTSISGRLEAERGAYERARAFDVETIERQNKEIRRLRDENRKLRGELSEVKRRVFYLEQEKIPALERELHEHFPESPDHQ